jgi:hypothetical protein
MVPYISPILVILAGVFKTQDPNLIPISLPYFLTLFPYPISLPYFLTLFPYLISLPCLLCLSSGAMLCRGNS